MPRSDNFAVSDNLVEGKRSRRRTPITRKTPGTTPSRKTSKVEEKSEHASGQRDARYHFNNSIRDENAHFRIRIIENIRVVSVLDYEYFPTCTTCDVLVSCRKVTVAVKSGVKRKLVGPQATSTPTPKRTKTAAQEEGIGIDFRNLLCQLMNTVRFN